MPRAIADDVERAVLRESGLEQRLVPSAGPAHRRARRALASPSDLLEPGALPGHARMVPGEKDEPTLLRIEARGRIEIVTRGDDARRARRGDAGPFVETELDRNQAILGLALGARSLLDGDEPAPVGRDREIRMGGAGLDQGSSGAADRAAVDPAIGVVHEEDPVAPDRVLAAAVFVDPRSNVDAGRTRLGERAPRRGGPAADEPREPAIHHHLASAFRRPSLEPAESIGDDTRRRDPARADDERSRIDRRRPAAIRAHPLHTALPLLRPRWRGRCGVCMLGRPRASGRAMDSQ